uniref:Reverse transcriptase domain-containing protein n=1 Tax=Mola mola TaxID=94237 RepID=A0A3Q3VRY6_MOLML
MRLRPRSPPFQLHRGTRQGCPLSPLVFALVLEPLAIAIRQNNIVGIKAGGKEHKLLLYADDILLLCRCPSTTIPHILSLIDSFSGGSSYKINCSKSKMPLSRLCPLSVRQGCQFSWQPSGLTYLGIKITLRLDNIMTINHLPLIQKIELMLQNWTELGLSLQGKIDILKMAIVPKIDYISNMLPLSNALLKHNEAVYNFLWAAKKPYINRTKLYAAIEDGGLGLPHMVWYHYAFCLKQLSKLYMTADQAPVWVGIDTLHTLTRSRPLLLKLVMSSLIMIQYSLSHRRHGEPHIRPWA